MDYRREQTIVRIDLVEGCTVFVEAEMFDVPDKIVVFTIPPPGKSLQLDHQNIWRMDNFLTPIFVGGILAHLALVAFDLLLQIMVNICIKATVAAGLEGHRETAVGMSLCF